jgi:hypothetical protein
MLHNRHFKSDTKITLPQAIIANLNLSLYQKVDYGSIMVVIFNIGAKERRYM